MSTLLKKSILSFLAFLILFFSIAPGLSEVHAQSTGTWYNSGFFDWYAKVYDENKSPSNEIFGERYTAAQVEWVLYSIPSVIINHILSIAPGSTSCIVYFSTHGPTDLVACGVALAAFTAKTTTVLGLTILLAKTDTKDTTLAKEVFLNTKNRQMSGINYLKDLRGRLSPVTAARAQGFGYTALNPIQKYWTGFRNMAYSIVVLITIIFAFLIMFKVKLNPQTVITVQSALPKIIVAVLLATFSYAIAGFLIDLMYVVGGLFASLLTTAKFAKSPVDAYSWIFPSSGTFTGTSFYIFFFMLAYAVYFLLALIVAMIAIVFGNLVVFGLFGIIASLLFLILFVWIVILMLWYTIKIPYVLLKNLVSVYLSIVVGPLQIIAGSLVPSIGFGQWLKKLISELLVFPVTGLFMYLAWITLGSSIAASDAVLGGTFWAVGGTSGRLWAPEIIGSTGSMSPLLWLVISFTFIALLPKVIDLMKGMIMGERFSFGSAVGEAGEALSTAWGYTGANLVRGAQEKAGYRITEERADAIVEWFNKRFPRRKNVDTSV